MTAPITIPVDHDLADLIVRRWLKRHLEYAHATAADTGFNDEDRLAAMADCNAIGHILAYIGEEE